MIGFDVFRFIVNFLAAYPSKFDTQAFASIERTAL
jgi:hypothetical protein